MRYIVKYNAGSGWYTAKQLCYNKCGTSSNRIIYFDTLDQTAYTVSKYANLGYDVKVVEVK